MLFWFKLQLTRSTLWSELLLPGSALDSNNLETAERPDAPRKKMMSATSYSTSVIFCAPWQCVALPSAEKGQQNAGLSPRCAPREQPEATCQRSFRRFFFRKMVTCWARSFDTHNCRSLKNIIWLISSFLGNSLPWIISLSLSCANSIWEFLHIAVFVGVFWGGQLLKFWPIASRIESNVSHSTLKAKHRVLKSCGSSTFLETQWNMQKSFW